MTIRKLKLLLPALTAAVIVGPVALAQVGVGAKGGVAVGVQAGPVRSQAQVGVDAAAHSSATHQALDAVPTTGAQVGGTVKTVARPGARAAGKASSKAAGAVSANAKANATAAVGGDAAAGEAEPEEDDRN